MSFKHFKIIDEDDDDPMLSAVNLVDVFLVLVVALLAAVASSSQSASPVNNTLLKAGEPDMEIVATEQGREIRYRGTGGVSEGEGVRAGVAYRLRDGSIIYVPEGEAVPIDSGQGKQ